MTRALDQFVMKINDHILKLDQEYKSEMGSTLAMIVLCDDYTAVVNIGDSRVYRVQKEKLECLTKDDNYATDLASLGTISQVDIR